MKENAKYFTHDSDMRNDIRVKAVRKRFGLEGYAVWCMLLEMMTDCDNFELPWDDMNRELLSYDFEIEQKLFCEIVNYCISLKLFSVENKKLFSLTMKKRFKTLVEFRDKKAAAGRAGMASRWDNNKNINTLSVITYDNTVITDDNTAITNDNTIITDDNTAITNDNYKSRVEYSKSIVENINSKINSINCSPLPPKEGGDSDSLPSKTDGKDDGRQDKLNYQGIVDYFNEKTKGVFPKVRTITDKRRRLIKRVFDKFGRDKFILAVDNMMSSKYLRGEVNGWQADFDWMVNFDHFVRIVEGNYANDRKHPSADNALGCGEFLNDDGRRTYGTGKTIVPDDAPARPSSRHTWSLESKTWIYQP